MWAPDPSRRSALGLAALMIVAAVAGFLVAEPAASREYRTVETVGEDSNAYAVDLPEEKRLRFVLEAPDETEPRARFHVYDPADEHFGSFELAGDGDDVTVLADQPGAWVVFVTEAEAGDLAVQVEGDEADDDQVRSLEVHDETWTVASQTGGDLDRDLALRLDRRPAQAHLEVDGAVEDLDAQAASEEGLVHELSGVDSAAGTGLVNGSQEVRPANLARGTYEIQATADHLNGTIVFAAQDYERPDRPAVDETSANGTEDGADANASQAQEPEGVVADLSEGEAAEVAPQGADELAFHVPDDVQATVYVYDGSADLVEVVEVGEDGEDDRREDRRDRDRDDEESTLQRASYPLAASGDHAVYVADLDEHRWDDGNVSVTVSLPGTEDPRPADDLAVEETEVTVDEDDNGTASVALNGSLAAVGASSDGWTWDDDDVTVEGPRGVVLESSEGDDEWDSWWGHGYETHPERFTDGTFTVTVEDEGFELTDRETHVKFAYLVD